MTEPNIWIQWKGTDACFDVHCECGQITHFDGYFAYAIKCAACGMRYDIQQTVALLPFSGNFEPLDSVDY